MKYHRIIPLKVVLVLFIGCLNINMNAQPTWCPDTQNLNYPDFNPPEITIHGIDTNNYITIDGEIDDVWDNITAYDLTASTADLPDDYGNNDAMWAKMAYDDFNLYVLVYIEDDTLCTDNSSTYPGDYISFRYQKDYGGTDTGTIAGHDDVVDWKYWYWKRDGDRKWNMPNAIDEINNPSTCTGYWLDQEGLYDIEFTLINEELLNQSMQMEADTNELIGGYQVVYEFSFSWDTWLKWDRMVTQDDTIGFDIVFNDEDEIEDKCVGLFTMSAPHNNGYCCAYYAAMCHIGPKDIIPAEDISINNPNSSSNWYTESNYSILWSDNISSNVKIELYNDLSFVSTISSSTSSDGYYSWNIPSTVNSGSYYRIKITSTTNASVYDYSDFFTITNNSASDDALEPNNTYDQAYSLGSILNYSNNNLTIIKGDEDWFSFKCDGATYYFKIEGYSFSTEGNYGLSFEKTGSEIIIETFHTSGDYTDTKLYLYDNDHSTLLDYDDDGGSGAYSYISYAMNCNTATYNVNFIVKNNNTQSPVNNAQVTLGAYGSQYTNTSGETTFTDVVPENNLGYTVSATNYEQASSTISVTNQNVTENVSLIPLNLKYDVTFTVLDETLTPLPGAIVSLDGYGTLTTDNNGEVIFSDISPGNDINYTVTALDYQKYTGTVSVVDQDVDKQVNMTAAPAGTYNVVFHITDKQLNPLSNIAINLSGYGNGKTSPDGKAIFAGVSPANDIACYIEAPGFLETYDSVDVVDQDISKPIQLERGSYSITFIVTDQKGIAIEGAAVNLLGEGTQTTNASGQTVFSNVLSGSNLTYIVTSPEHATITDTIASFTNDMIETVKIRYVGIEKIANNEIKIFPNPVNNILHIENINAVKRISIKNITGQIIRDFEMNGQNKVEISTKDMKPGYYIIYFIDKNNKLTVKKIINN